VVRGQLRVAEGRDPEPSAGLIDSQSVKGADTVGRESRGYDAWQEDQWAQAVHRHRHPRLLLTVVVLTAGAAIALVERTRLVIRQRALP
jgi:hypothetical protein